MVRVGDPVDLEVTVRGAGRLGGLIMPRLDGEGGLDPKQISVPGDLPTGELIEEGKGKKFLVTVRLESDKVREVPPLPFRPDVSRMAAVAKRMTRESLDALIRRDAQLALRVWQADVEADRLYRELIGEAIQFMREHPERIGDVMHLVGALRNLERLADHATNIAEDVIYLVEGEIVRHRPAAFRVVDG